MDLAPLDGGGIGRKFSAAVGWDRRRSGKAMKVAEIAFVAYPVTDLGRARGFYEKVLGLTPAREFGDGVFCWVEYDLGPGTLAIATGIPDWPPSRGGGSVGLEVDDFPGAMREVEAAGCRVLTPPMETPVCHIAVVADPDGNAVILHHRRTACGCG